MDLVVADLGFGYSFETWQVLQDKYWEVCVQGSQNRLVFAEHPPVYTAGASCAGNAEKIQQCFKKPVDQLPANVALTRRGGLVTYQGPGILSTYCIFKIGNLGINFLHEILHRAGMSLLQCYGIENITVGAGEKRGLFLEPGKKIASFGFQISRGVSRYGCAISLDPEQIYLDPLIPCGLEGYELTSLARELRREKFSREEKAAIQQVLVAEITARLN